MLRSVSKLFTWSIHHDKAIGFYEARVCYTAFNYKRHLLHRLDLLLKTQRFFKRQWVDTEAFTWMQRLPFLCIFAYVWWGGVAHLHFGGWALGAEHPISLLDHFIELGVHGHPWVRAASCWENRWDAWFAADGVKPRWNKNPPQYRFWWNLPKEKSSQSNIP